VIVWCGGGSRLCPLPVDGVCERQDVLAAHPEASNPLLLAEVGDDVAGLGLCPAEFVGHLLLLDAAAAFLEQADDALLVAQEFGVVAPTAVVQQSRQGRGRGRSDATPEGPGARGDTATPAAARRWGRGSFRPVAAG